MVHVPVSIPALVDRAVRTSLASRTVSHLTFPVDMQEAPADADDRFRKDREELTTIAQALGAKPPRIGLLGTSMGGQGALRLSYKFPDRFPVVAAISPAVDYYKRYHEGDETIPLMYPDPEAARQDSATLHIHPLNWPRHQFFCCDPTDTRWHDSADRLRMKLWSIGIPHECDLETEAGGHSFQYASHMAERAVGFIAKRLEQERLRVV